MLGLAEEEDADLHLVQCPFQSICVMLCNSEKLSEDIREAL